MTPFEAFLECGSVSTDTRQILPGSVFFALKGAHFNGNNFAHKALELGAAYAVIDEDVEPSDRRFIRVDHVLTALQETARFYRRYLNIPIIGLTGSNGKTTNKELFSAVLTKKYKVFATPGNFNNHIGVPLTLLNIPKDTEIAVVEMGANHQGEIAALCSICEPNLGYITNFGKAHLEGFGGVEGVIKGKSELYRFLSKTEGTVLLNAEDSTQVIQSTACQNTYTFSSEGQASIRYNSASQSEFAAITFETKSKFYFVQSKLSGLFNETNLAAAVAVGTYWNVEPAEIVDALENYVPQMNRIEWRETQHNKVLLDAYNANPTSMELSLENFAKWHNDGWIILGDMFELGSDAFKEHQNVVNQIRRLNMEERCILIGEHFEMTDWTGLCFKNAPELSSYWQKKGAPKDAYILLKGSRGVALEQLLPLL